MDGAEDLTPCRGKEKLNIQSKDSKEKSHPAPDLVPKKYSQLIHRKNRIPHLIKPKAVQTVAKKLNFKNINCRKMDQRRVDRMRILQHYFNSLHLFCRLRSLGLSKSRALRLCRVWEKVIHPYIYRRAIRRRAF